MDNFTAVYKILSTLEACMDLQEPSLVLFDAKALGVSDERWKKYIEMMADVGYIKGAVIEKYIGGQTIVDCSNVQITLKGLEYLQESAIMQKIYKTTKGVIKTAAEVAAVAATLK